MMCTVLLEFVKYRIAGNFRQGKISPNPDVQYCVKISPDLFSCTCDCTSKPSLHVVVYHCGRLITSHVGALHSSPPSIPVFPSLPSKFQSSFHSIPPPSPSHSSSHSPMLLWTLAKVWEMQLFIETLISTIGCAGMLGGIGCDGSGQSCTYTASYAVQPDDTITFTVSATTAATN